MESSPSFGDNISPPGPLSQAPKAIAIITQKWSDLQDFCEGSQSSQIGPHLVQPFSIAAKASALRIIAERFNISRPVP
jgi:hypothetical protein